MLTDKSLKSKGIFKSAEAKDFGLSNTDVTRLVDRRALIKLDRGIYIHSDCQLSPKTIDFAVACKRFGPEAVIGGLSALFHYNLTETVPSKVWALVPTKKKTTDKKYRLIRSTLKFTYGIQQEDTYQMTTIERTLVEALYYFTKIGLDMAIKAAAIALKNKQTTLPKIIEMAKLLGLESTINRHWETLSSIEEIV